MRIKLLIFTAQTPPKIMWFGTSLVAQSLRIHLPMQGTQVRSLVWEDPTCRRPTKPMQDNYWACALEPTHSNYWARVLQLLQPMRLEPVLRNKRSPHSPQLEKACTQQQRPSVAKKKSDLEKCSWLMNLQRQMTDTWLSWNWTLHHWREKDKHL